MKKIFYVVFLTISLIALSACNDNSKTLEMKKSFSEVLYLENQCITIFNKYFNDEYNSEDESIDWNLISDDFNIAINSLDVILIDFASVQVPSKSIVELENNFKDMESYIQMQDLNKYIQKICDSYNLVSSSILDNITQDEQFKLEKKAKSNLIYIGYYLKTENKEEALNNVELFKDNYSKLSSNRNYIENNSYKINKIYLKIENLKSEIEEDNFEKAEKTLIKIFEFF